MAGGVRDSLTSEAGLRTSLLPLVSTVSFWAGGGAEANRVAPGFSGGLQLMREFGYTL
jgi:hypothetical protein